MLCFILFYLLTYVGKQERRGSGDLESKVKEIKGENIYVLGGACWLGN